MFQPSSSPDRARRDVRITLFALAVTAIAILLLGRDLVSLGRGAWAADSPWAMLRVALLAVAVVSLLYGVVVYEVVRLGAYQRAAAHEPVSYEQLIAADGLGRERLPLTVLIPSYKEDLRTIRQTVLSAALQDYPERRVVLLLDDPPYPDDPADAKRLAVARRLPGELTRLLAPPRAAAEAALAAFEARIAHGFDPRPEVHRLLDAYDAADAWFAAQAAATPIADHTDAHFVALTFDAHRDLLRASARSLLPKLAAGMTVDELAGHYRHLVARFRVEIGVFERKRYANLAHAANKAANLNSYLDLIGRSVREAKGRDGRHLLACDPGEPGAVSVPDAAYVITLDADSMLAPDYARRLAAVMERPGNERVAVVQTPYSAIPGAAGAVERIAGATTDVQYLVHQGFTRFDATYWVGANALLRMDALRDIRTEEEERGYRVPSFIKDRTVIEDTESTIDLVARGWTLHNHPERLAYSATPPDFGALLIQRRRWANGGLLILPKLIRDGWWPRGRVRRSVEVAIRAHYLVSPALSSLGLLLLLFLPLGDAFLSPWLLLAGLPYALLYWRDLVLAGYRRSDYPRVYAFNWLLLPVNVAGVLKSMQQGITGAKIPFGRTPKVQGRTAAPGWAVGVLLLLCAHCLVAVTVDVLTTRWYHAGFTATTAAAFVYALAAFVGVRAGLEDLWAAVPPGVKRLPAARQLQSRIAGD